MVGWVFAHYDVHVAVRKRHSPMRLIRPLGCLSAGGFRRGSPPSSSAASGGRRVRAGQDLRYQEERPYERARQKQRCRQPQPCKEVRPVEVDQRARKHPRNDQPTHGRNLPWPSKHLLAMAAVTEHDLGTHSEGEHGKAAEEDDVETGLVLFWKGRGHEVAGR